MEKQEFHTTEKQRKLEVTSVYLEEAEETLWNLSKDTASSDVVDEIDELLEDLWELQNKTAKLEDDIESDHTGSKRRDSLLAEK